MGRTLIVSATLSALASAASAASFDTPLAPRATHEDFLVHLEAAASGTGETSVAAKAVHALAEPHITAEERVILPFLGFTEVVAEGRTGAVPETAQQLESLTAELALMPEAQTSLVTALVVTAKKLPIALERCRDAPAIRASAAGVRPDAAHWTLWTSFSSRT